MSETGKQADEQDILTYEESLILSHIETGAENATRTDFLRDITGLPERRIRKVIRDLRLAGFPVCSQTFNGGGYYLPGDAFEVSRFKESMRKRGLAIFEVIGE